MRFSAPEAPKPDFYAKVGRTRVPVYNGIAHLDDAALNEIIKPTIEKINNWWRVPNPFKLVKLDTDFFYYLDSRSIKGFQYKGNICQAAEINYIAQGHAHAHLRLPSMVSDALVYSHNALFGRKPTPGKLHWTRKGYMEYSSRKNW